MISPFKKFYPKIHKDSYIASSSNIIGRVVLMKDSSVWHGAVLRGDINSISVGRRSNIQDLCVLHVEKDTPCIVESDVTVGHQATIHACTVQKGCLVGIGAKILNRAVIGKESIIGAGALILEGVKIPPRSLVVGMPGKVIRKLSLKEVRDLKKSADNYVKLSKVYADQDNEDRHVILPKDMKVIQDLSRIF